MAGTSDYLRNKIIDWFYRGVAFTPPATQYVALVKTTPNAATPGTEITGTGYARQPISKSTSAFAATDADGSTAGTSSGITGKTSNNAVVNFGTAGSAWGLITYWQTYDASSGGNFLQWGQITDSLGNGITRTIANGDPVSFPISSLTMTWS